MLQFTAPKSRIHVPTEARFVEIVTALDDSITVELAADLYRLGHRNPVRAIAAVHHDRKHHGGLDRIEIQEWIEPK